MHEFMVVPNVSGSYLMYCECGASLIMLASTPGTWILVTLPDGIPVHPDDASEQAATYGFTKPIA